MAGAESMVTSQSRFADLITASDVVLGAVQVIDLSRRNHNLAVDRSAGQSFLVKHYMQRDTSESREHYLYGLVHEQADAVSAGVPRTIAHPGSSLCLAYFPNAMTLNQLVVPASAFPTQPAKALGSWLGSLHSAERLRSPERAQQLSGCLPWILTIDRPTPELLNSLSGASLRLLETIQQQADIAAALHELRRSWRRDALIHNDLKWDNIITVPSPQEQHAMLMVIDWELAGVGDARWDLGSVFAAFLAMWGGSIPILRDAPPDSLLSLAEHPLETLQPAANAFWFAYQASARQHGEPAYSDVDTVMRHCGARLIQNAIERAQLRSTLAADSVILLQIAQNVIRHPREAAQHLLALKSHTTQPS